MRDLCYVAGVKSHGDILRSSVGMGQFLLEEEQFSISKLVINSCFARVEYCIFKILCYMYKWVIFKKNCFFL